MQSVGKMYVDGAKNAAYNRAAAFQSSNALFYPVYNVDGTVPEKFPVTQKEFENISGRKFHFAMLLHSVESVLLFSG